MIIGSYDKNKIVEFCKESLHYSHSISYYDVENHSMFSVNRSPGCLIYSKLDRNDHLYGIVFLQNLTEKHIQPASVYNIDAMEHGGYAELWFEGELKPSAVQKIQVEEETEQEWPPDLLLRHILRYGAPSEIEGSLSCVYTNGEELYVFRNELGALFVDENINICTVPFPNSKTVPSGKIFRIDFENKKLEFMGEEFETIKQWYPEEN